MKAGRANGGDATRFELRRRGARKTKRTRFPLAEWITAVIAVSVLFAPVPVVVRLTGLVVAAVALAAARGARHVATLPAGFIAVDGAGIVRERGGTKAPLAAWGTPFGVTLLTNGSRMCGLLAFTTGEQRASCRCARPARTTRARPASSSARASTVTDLDIAHAPSASATADALSAGDALRVLSAVRARDPQAIAACSSPTRKGRRSCLEGDELRAGDRAMNLASPLEWRAFTFVESMGPVASVLQATWVRQQTVEMVLVAAVAEGGVTREHAATAAPPPHELRIAVERVFMAPFKDALARAPRASRTPLSPQRSRNVDRRA